MQRVSAIGKSVFVANGDGDPMILRHFSYLLAGLIPQAWVKMYPDAVAGISDVINFDPPQSCTDYVHRVGRTARAGRSGVVITYVLSDEARDVEGIVQRAGPEARVRNRPDGTSAPGSGRNGRGHNGGRRNDSRRNGATRGGPARPARNGAAATS